MSSNSQIPNQEPDKKVFACFAIFVISVALLGAIFTPDEYATKLSPIPLLALKK